MFCRINNLIVDVTLKGSNFEKKKFSGIFSWQINTSDAKLVTNDKLKFSMRFILFIKLFQRFLKFVLMVVLFHSSFYTSYGRKSLTADEATAYVTRNEVKHQDIWRIFFERTLPYTKNICVNFHLQKISCWDAFLKDKITLWKYWSFSVFRLYLEKWLL